MDSLTKENFWNRMKDLFPAEVEAFCKWIDDYKRRVDWEKLFNYGFPHYAKQGWHNPKYHDLPISMQVGIFFEFVADSSGTDSHDSIFGQIHSMKAFTVEIEQYFKDCIAFTKRERNSSENF